MQRVNYAFFQPDARGNIFGTDRWGDPQLLFGPYTEKLMGGIQKCSYDGPEEINCAYHEHNAGIINLAHQAGAEVYPSIGGWTLRYDLNYATIMHLPIVYTDICSLSFLVTISLCLVQILQLVKILQASVQKL